MSVNRFVVALALVVLGSGPLVADILEQILVKVNGEIITKTELEERQVAYLRQRNQQYTDEELKKVLAEITPQILAEAIDELLLVQRGRELGYRLTDEQFKEILDRIKKENKLETEEQFQAALKQERLTMADLRRSLERQAIIARVQQIDGGGRVGVTEVETREYYDAHPLEFTTPATVTLREILIEVPEDAQGLNVARDEEGKAKADLARARIVAGEDFGRVAAEVSTAPSRANGGLIGPISRSELSPAVLQLLDRLNQGGTSEVLRTTRGYQLLKLESVSEASVRPFEQVREQVADRVFNDRRLSEFRRYVTKLRGQAEIEWKNEELKKAYEGYLKTSS